MDADRRLREITQTSIPTDWCYKGPFAFISGDTRLEGLDSSFISLREKGGARGRLDVPRGSLDEQRAQRGELGIRDAGAVATHAYIFPKYFAKVVGCKIRLHDLAVGRISGEVAFSRETLLGATLGVSNSTVAPELRTTVFGRRALVTNYQARKGSPYESIQVAYEGAPFDLQGDERPTLHDLLRFLTGRRGASWFVEAFDAEGQRLNFYFRDCGRITKWRSFLQPIDLAYHSPEVLVLATALPEMLDRLRACRRKKRVKVEATIHHYNDGASQSYPTSRLRDFSVAVEALVGAIRGTQPKTVLWLESGFEARIKNVLNEFDACFNDVASSTSQIIRKKIEESNRTSPREDVRRFLSSSGINLAAEEEAVLRSYRNGVLHTGHKGDESDFATLQCNGEAASALANIFNRTTLKTLGYPGSYREAETFTSLPLDQAPSYPLIAEELRSPVRA